MKKIYIVPRVLKSINLQDNLLQNSNGAVSKTKNISTDKTTEGKVIDADSKLFHFYDDTEEPW